MRDQTYQGPDTQDQGTTDMGAKEYPATHAIAHPATESSSVLCQRARRIRASQGFQRQISLLRMATQIARGELAFLKRREWYIGSQEGLEQLAWLHPVAEVVAWPILYRVGVILLNS